MGGVAVAAHALIDGLSWPAAFVLGAVVAPTDPVAATATFSRMHVPERVGLLVEGEAMVNDATALVAFRVALGAAIAGSFSVAHAGVDFVVSAVAGVAIGLAAGWIEVHVLRKLDDRPLSILLSLLFPYAAYVAAEEAHVSGVLAAVVCGLYLGWFAHETFSADTRLSASAFWEVLVFGLNALLFLLLGLQFPAIVDDARAGDSFGTLLLTALALAAVVVLIRTRRRVPAVHAHRRRLARAAGDRVERHARRDLARGRAVGARDRGRPARHPVRDGRGDRSSRSSARASRCPRCCGSCGCRASARGRPTRRSPGWRPRSPRSTGSTSSRTRAAISEEQLRRMRELYRARFRACQAVLGGGDQDGAGDVRETRRRYSDLRRELIGVERDVLLGLRNEGKLRPDVQRLIQRDLDLEEARLT